MRKVLALAVVALFCAVVTLAHSSKAVGGTISKLDMSGKSMVVKAADGTETTVYWNDGTKVQGTLKEGETVHVKASEKDGKVWALSVHVGKMEPKKAEPKTEPKQ